nr:folate family ECF transporter S component [Bittarella massiliensis (ex Durand et al. 2017)]
MAAREFRTLSSLAGASMMTALNVVLSFFTLRLSELLKVGFSFLAVAATGFLYGPLLGAAAGGIGDIVKYLIHPDGPYFIGFTFNACLSGFLYGLYLYKKPVKLWRAVCAKLTVSLVINLLLNPLFLSILYGKAFVLISTVRLTKQLVMFPVDTALLYGMLRLLERVRVRQMGAPLSR